MLGTLATRWSSRRTAKAYPWQTGLTATGGVGPVILATTLDPTGVFHRKEVPSTLAPLRLRPPYRTGNPEGPAVDSRSLVLECEDGGVRVLVVARRKGMPVVLGALGSLQPAPESPSRTTRTRSR
ncbi:hypothetical protein [Streptomyces sp. NPDC007346]|uniref:hypothetical protein n=1 Tax=Streptomyces sp. NPDC007346 TaxID=3154682 RepID=UPI003452488F